MKDKYKLPVDYTKLKTHEKRIVRLQYIEQQNNLCFYCKESLNLLAPQRIRNKWIDLDLFPPGFIDYPIHLQHNHKTNMTEGAVHCHCNAVMWQYENR